MTVLSTKFIRHKCVIIEPANEVFDSFVTMHLVVLQ